MTIDMTKPFIVLTTHSVALGTDITEHLAGIGLMLAEPVGDQWRFTMSVKATSCDAGEAPLLAWALTVLPSEAVVIGWQLAEATIPALLDAVDATESELAAAFLVKLHRLLTGRSIDLAIDHGGAGAGPLIDLLRERCVLPAIITDQEVERAWIAGRSRVIEQAIEAQLLGLTHLALMTDEALAPVRVAFGRWLRDQRADGRIG